MRRGTWSAFFEGAGSLSWVWCRRDVRDLNFSLKNAIKGPRVGTQATTMETFSSTLKGMVRADRGWVRETYRYREEGK